MTRKDHPSPDRPAPRPDQYLEQRTNLPIHKLSGN